MINCDDLIGIPFVHKGRDKRTGFDCWGVVLEILKRNGKVIEDPVPDYKQDWQNDVGCQNYLLENYAKQWRKLDAGEAYQELDIVLIGKNPDYPHHIGIIIDDYSILHSTEKTGVIITKINSIDKFINGIYRLKG